MAFNWIIRELQHHFRIDPETIIEEGIDLDGDGRISEQERLPDTSSGEEDWSRYLWSNQNRLMANGLFAHYFRSSENSDCSPGTFNPVHMIISAELRSGRVTQEQADAAYGKLEEILRAVRNHPGIEELSEEERFQFIYTVLENLNTDHHSAEADLFTTDLIAGIMDCDTSSMVVLSIAHEMGWRARAIRVREHMFIRAYRDDETFFYIDHGEITSIQDYYFPIFGITRESISSGAYLQELDENGILSDVLANLSYRLDNIHAISYLNEAIEFDCNNANAFYTRGIFKFEAGDFQGAREDYENAIRLDPSFYSAYNLLGLVNEQLGNYQEAIQNFTMEINLIQENINQVQMVGHLNGWHWLVIRLYRRNLASAHESRARINFHYIPEHNRYFRWEDDIALSRRLNQIADHYENYVRLSEAGDNEEALSELEEAATLDQESSCEHQELGLLYERPLHFNCDLALLYSQLAYNNEAVQEFEICAENALNAPKALLGNLVATHISQQDPNMALPYLEVLADPTVDDPTIDRARLQYEMGLSYYHLGDFEQAIYHMETGLELYTGASRDDIRAWSFQYMGMSYFEQGNYQAAAFAFETALEFDDEIFEIHYYLAMSLFELGESNRSEYEWHIEEARRLDTTNPLLENW